MSKKTILTILGATLYLALTKPLAGLSAGADPASPASTPALREVSYYPRNHAWLDFWQEWDQTKHEMASDLDLIQDLGANTVRLFIHPRALASTPAFEYEKFPNIVSGRNSAGPMPAPWHCAAWSTAVSWSAFPA